MDKATLLSKHYSINARKRVRQKREEEKKKNTKHSNFAIFSFLFSVKVMANVVDKCLSL